MLSKRMILFSSFQPYWICQKCLRAGGEPTPEEYFSALDLQDLFRPLSKQNFDGEKFGYLWPWVAESYSSRVLSVLDDKILAIHAVKERYREDGAVYCAGVWLQYLTIDLLWSTVTRHERSDEDVVRFGSAYLRGRITHLPSWSWLSFDGSIRNEIVWHAYYSEKIQSKDAITSHIQLIKAPSTDLFGRLSGSSLRICGPIKQVLVIPTKGPGFEGRDQGSSCYDLAIWDSGIKAYRVGPKQLPRNRIGQAVFDDFVPLPKETEGRTKKGGLFELAEDYETEPMILDCMLVATVGGSDRDGAMVTGPQEYVSRAKGDLVAYGLLLSDLPNFIRTRKSRVGLFRGNDGFASYFEDAVESEFDFV